MSSLNESPAIPNQPSADGPFTVRFWGVRGSVPTPGADNARYGGNTSCVDVCLGQQRLILDGGTGLRVLGQTLMAEAPLEAHLFFTHSHWDRIQGFPFFKPAFVEGNSFHIYGGLAVNGASIKQRLMDQMVRPNFPVPLHLMAADLQFHNIVPGETIELEPGIQIETCPLNPSERALGYRISWQDQTVVYATDVDCHPDSPDPALLYLARQANLLIYDTAQAEQDYGVDKPTDSYAPAWQKGIDVAKAASVEQLALFHHDPCHGDAWLEPMEEKVQSLFGAACFAREGMVVDLLPQMA